MEEKPGAVGFDLERGLRRLRQRDRRTGGDLCAVRRNPLDNAHVVVARGLLRGPDVVQLRQHRPMPPPRTPPGSRRRDRRSTAAPRLRGAGRTESAPAASRRLAPGTTGRAPGPPTRRAPIRSRTPPRLPRRRRGVRSFEPTPRFLAGQRPQLREHEEVEAQLVVHDQLPHGRLTDIDHAAVRRQRDIRAMAARRSVRERRIVAARAGRRRLFEIERRRVGDLGRIQQLVLDEHGRALLVAGQLRQQPANPVTPRTGDDAQARHAEEQALHALAVRRPVAPMAARRQADEDRTGDRVVVHVVKLGRVVDQLIGGQRREVREHDLGDRPQASEGQSVGDADNRGLRDRRREHLVRKPRREPARDLERAAVRIVHVLAEEHDAGIAFHRRVERLVECVDDPHRRLAGIGAQVGGRDRLVVHGPRAAAVIHRRRPRRHALGGGAHLVLRLGEHGSDVRARGDHLRQRIGLPQAIEQRLRAMVVALAVRHQAPRLDNLEERTALAHARDGLREMASERLGVVVRAAIRRRCRTPGCV